CTRSLSYYYGVAAYW
nr:immunoglobulin heavy chain junction region [Mus musculus]